MEVVTKVLIPTRFSNKARGRSFREEFMDTQLFRSNFTSNIYLRLSYGRHDMSELSYYSPLPSVSYLSGSLRHPPAAECYPPCTRNFQPVAETRGYAPCKRAWDKASSTA